MNTGPMDHREGAARQHRMIGLFAVMQCWVRDLDGVVFQRRHLERLLGLERFKETRIEWFLTDIEEFFPHCQQFVSETDAFRSLWVSRREMAAYVPDGYMKDEDRIRQIQQGGPRLGLFKLWDSVSTRSGQLRPEAKASIPFFSNHFTYDEHTLSAYLVLLSQGQVSPRTLPGYESGEMKTA